MQFGTVTYFDSTNRLTGAPSIFQRLMDFVPCGLSYVVCLFYIDDIIAFGRTMST